MSKLAFEKWHGLGNDFVVVDAEALPPDVSDAVITRLCDRRFGVGGDGVLVVGRAEGVDATMVVRNADGSRPEMCGNGLRCVVGWLAERGRVQRGAVVRTDAGDLACELEAQGSGRASVEVAMGRVTVGSAFEVQQGGRAHRFRTASIGNPHAITFEPYESAARDVLGPLVEKTPASGTNVEFVSIEGDLLDVVVWERGVGYTLACGTGACAVAAVAVHEERVPRGRPLRVRLPGGELLVHVERDGAVRMKGPAERAFVGSTDLG